MLRCCCYSYSSLLKSNAMQYLTSYNYKTGITAVKEILCSRKIQRDDTQLKRMITADVSSVKLDIQASIFGKTGFCLLRTKYSNKHNQRTCMQVAQWNNSDFINLLEASLS